MKAAVFYEKGDLRIEEKALREIGPDEVLMKVHACGICGTDVHIFHGDEGATKTPTGTALGHEFAGEIVEIGSKVKGLKPGDKICVDPNKLCNSCTACLEANGHFCDTMTGIGTTVDGGFAEYCIVPASQAYVFPSELSYEKAAMTEPVSCCLHGIDMCDINAGDTVAVIGCGMIGLIMLQLAKLRGAARIIAIEPVASKREEALKLGADVAYDPTKISNEEIVDIEGRISCVIECAGINKVMENAVKLAGYKSTLMLFGLTAPNDIVSIKPFELFKKEITIKASFINPYTFSRALSLIASGKVDVSSMVYKYEPLEKLPAILADEELRRNGKIIIKCN